MTCSKQKKVMTHNHTHNSVAYACVTYDLVVNDLDLVFSLSLRIAV